VGDKSHHITSLSSFVSMYLELKKDPGIPNLFPLKEQLLQQILRNKKKAIDEKERNQKRKKKFRLKKLSLAAQQLTVSSESADNIDQNVCNFLLGPGKFIFFFLSTFVPFKLC